jgi:hypothetical protein
VRGTVRHVDENRLDLEGNGTVLGKHGCYHVDNDVTAISWNLGAWLSLQLGLVRCGRVDENVCRLAWHDFGVFGSA